MEEKELWLKKVKEKLGNYSDPIPDSGWERLEQELSASDDRPVAGPLSIDRPLAAHPHRKWIVAAAAVLVAVSGISLLFLQSPEAEQVRQLSTSVYIPDEMPEQAEPHSIKEVEKTIRELRPSKQPVIARVEPKAVAGKPHNGTGITQEESKSSDEVVSDRDVTEEKKETQEEETKKEKGYLSKTSEALGNGQYSGKNGKTSSQKTISQKQSSRKGGKWAVGMSIGNIGETTLADGEASNGSLYQSGIYYGEATSSSGGIIKIPDGLDFSLNHGGVAYLQSKTNVIEAKHKQSLNFGLSIRKELTKGFSLESGLTYSLLSSDIKTADQSWRDQKLHYLGIPLRVGWSFYQRDGMTLYTTAGGAVEKCIYGKLDSEKQTVDPLQFSVGGAVGAQFNLNKRIGLYVEPGVTYFFDDGSPVETIRKDKPFNFNLQAGVRLSY